MRNKSPFEKIDPVHFFNSCGLAAVTEAWYLERIEKLEAENERLTRLLKRKTDRESLSDFAN